MRLTLLGLLIGLGVQPLLFTAARAADPGDLVWFARVAGHPTISNVGFENVINGISTLPDGGLAAAGQFVRQATFALGAAAQTTVATPSRCGWLARWAGDGQLAWVRQVHGGNQNQIDQIGSDPGGGIAVAGLYTVSASFGEGDERTTSTAPGVAMFVARYGTAGNFHWVRRAFDFGSLARSGGVAVLPDGGVLMAGWFTQTMRLGDGEPNNTLMTSAGQEDGYLARFAPNGTLAWTRRFGGVSRDYGFGIEVQGDVIRLRADLGPGAVMGAGQPNPVTVDQATSAYLRFNLAGQFLNYEPIQGDRSAAPDGGYYQGGAFLNDASFGSGEDEVDLVSYGGFDAYAARFAADGSLIWAQQGGSTQTDYGAVTALTRGGCIFAGNVLGSGARFSPQGNIIIEGGHELFVLELGVIGQVRWQRQAHDADFYHLARSQDGHLLIAGSYKAPATFNVERHDALTTPQPSALRDLFIAKLYLDDRAGAGDWAAYE